MCKLRTAPLMSAVKDISARTAKGKSGAKLKYPTYPPLHNIYITYTIRHRSYRRLPCCMYAVKQSYAVIEDCRSVPPCFTACCWELAHTHSHKCYAHSHSTHKLYHAFNAFRLRQRTHTARLCPQLAVWAVDLPPEPRNVAVTGHGS